MMVGPSSLCASLGFFDGIAGGLYNRLSVITPYALFYFQAAYAYGAGFSVFVTAFKVGPSRTCSYVRACATPASGRCVSV
jgi:hypothetical protein